MSESILTLLNSVSTIINKYEEEKAETGTSINLFKIAKIETDEVIICRILAYLLNPEERHYQNVTFLNLFLKEIGEDEITHDEKFSVITEYPTDKRRRIDIVLKSQYRFIPIEVKAEVNLQAKSLKIFRETYGTQTAFRFSLSDYVNHGVLKDCPLYALPMIREFLKI